MRQPAERADHRRALPSGGNSQAAEVTGELAVSVGSADFEPREVVNLESQTRHWRLLDEMTPSDSLAS
jgi:hypothetical protein